MVVPPQSIDELEVECHESQLDIARSFRRDVEMLLKNQSLGAVALALPALILVGGLISRICSRLLGKSHLKQKVLIVFHQAVRILGRLPYALSFAALSTGITLIAIALHVLGLHWKDVVQVLLQISLTSPIARGLSLAAIVAGGLMLNFAKSELKQILARIILGLGMAIGAANFLSIMTG